MPLLQQTNCQNCGGSCCQGICAQQELRCVYETCALCCTVPIRLRPEVSLSAGTILAYHTPTGFFDAYDPTGVDGLDEPVLVLKYPTVTDENGMILQSYQRPWVLDCGEYTTSAYFEGTFYIEQTVGNLQAALAFPSFGRRIKGALDGVGTWKLV